MRIDEVPTQPLGCCEMAEAMPRRKALKEGIGQISRSFFVEAARDAKVEARLVPVDDGTTEDGHQRRYEVRLEIDGVLLGRHSSPPPMRGEALRERFDADHVQRHAELLRGFVPDHLAVEPRILRALKARSNQPRQMEEGRRYWTTIFGSDDRRVFQDTNYPWAATGRCETNIGGFSGVMVGPRHMLTCSHGIDWTPPPGYAADWLTFTPSYFDGSAPFGSTYATNIYWARKENNDGFITSPEDEYDYTVLVLADRIGERTGWWGTKSYHDYWDGNPNWWHIGYPADISSGQRPIYINGFTMNGDDAQDDSHEAIYHQADVWPGQSGGPMFGFWDGDGWPSAVAVQSWQSSSRNGASGGASLVDLVIRARSDFP